MIDFKSFSSESVENPPFGKYEETAIISLLLDFPEVYAPLSHFLTSRVFQTVEAQYIITVVKDDFDKYGIVPSRKLLHDRLAKSLTVDDPYKEILDVVDLQSNPRETPILRQTLRSWAEHRVYDLLYSEEAIAAHHRGDHDVLKKIFDQASSINIVGQQGFWLFDQIDELFVDNAVEHIKTGWPTLDRHLNDGGPSPREVLVLLASTGVGKCHSLQSNIIEKDLSRIFELEIEEDGALQVVKLAGFREVQTARGAVKVCDLTDGDDIISLPIERDVGDISLPLV